MSGKIDARTKLFTITNSNSISQKKCRRELSSSSESAKAHNSNAPQDVAVAYASYLSLGLDSNNFICTRAFLTFANFKFNGLAVIKCRITAATLNFGVVNEKIFAAILRSDKAKTFICVEPLNCAFTHNAFSNIGET